MMAGFTGGTTHLFSVVSTGAAQLGLSIQDGLPHMSGI